MRETFHLVPTAVWTAADPDRPYEATTLASEGFIHCTDGLEALGQTFDRHFAADPRPFLAVTVNLEAIDVPWRFDRPDTPYPHVYGPIARRAIRQVERVVRRTDGRFESLAPT